MTSRESRAHWLRLVQIAVDVTAWTLGLWLAQFLRYDFVVERLFAAGVVYAALSVAVLQVAFGFLGHLYRGRYRYGSFDEVLGVLLAAACASVGLAVLNETVPAMQWVPRSVPFVGAFVAFTFMLGVRYLWRMRRESDHRSSGRRAGDVAQPLLLFGAGEGADQAIVAMLRDRASRYLPVGLLDDDTSKSNLRLRGVPVLGTRQDLARAAQQTGATSLLLAAPSADGVLVREVSALAQAAGLKVKVLPTVDHLLEGRVGVEDIRDLDLPDLLGRRQIELNLDSIAGYLTGRRVLVTRRAARSARSCVVNCRCTVRASSSCWTGTSRRCTPCSCRSPGGRSWTVRTWCLPTSVILTTCTASFPSANPRSSSMPPRSSTSRCWNASRARRSRATSGAP